MPNEQEQFLKDLEPSKENQLTDLLNAPLNETPVADPSETKDPKDPASESLNRQARRDKQALREERKASAEIASKLAETTERLERINNAKDSVGDTKEYLKSVEKIYGTDSPEASAATELLKSALKGVKDEAKREALDEFERKQQEANATAKKAESTLDSMLDDLEDEYNVDLTSPQAETLRKEFFKKLEKLSPKDSSGEIIQYADPRAVFEDLQAQIQKKPDPATRAKDVSARSMSNSVSTDTNAGGNDPTWDFLKKNGW